MEYSKKSRMENQKKKAGRGEKELGELWALVWRKSLRIWQISKAPHSWLANTVESFQPLRNFSFRTYSP